MITPDRITIASPNAPAAIGPYCQGVRAGGYIFCSGQIPLDPKTGQVVGKDISAQTERVLQNLNAVLEVTGSGLFQVVKTTVFLKSMEDFPAMNEVYKKYFAADPPARSTVEVSRLPKDVLVEIECVAYQPPKETSHGLSAF